MSETVEAAVVAVLWTVAAGFAITGTLFDETRLMFWAVILSLVSLTGTGHLIVQCVVRQERVRVERLVDAVLARASERADVEPPRLVKG